VEVRVDDASEPLRAEVVATDASVNVRSRNLGVRAKLPKDAADLLPGMLVRVTVPLGDTATAVVVPPTAVRRDALGAAVYVLTSVDEDGQRKTRARKRKVRLSDVREADLRQDMLVVVEGLSPGEQIAAVGAFKLRDGSLVLPSEPNPAAAERVVGR